MTSEHSQQNLFNMTQYAEDSPAKTYQLQVFKKVLPKKPDQVYFTNSSESYAWYDQNTLSWRTWQRSLIEGWTLFSGNFTKQGMMQNGQLYQQVLWEPVINDQDFGSLPTPLASVGNRRAKFAQGGTPLLGTLLPTPTTMDHLPQRGYESMVKQTQVHRKGRTKLANLREAVNPQTVELFNHLQSLPTPSANEHKYTLRDWDHQSGQCLAAMARKDRLSTPTGKPMSLNPAFVEEMMGYPIGHTDLEH